jgi:hypothetical protein
MTETITTEQHFCAIESVERGFQAACSCGWRGPVRDRMSDDYAWSNSDDDRKRHAPPAKRVRGYLGSTPDGGIDDGP